MLLTFLVGPLDLKALKVLSARASLSHTLAEDLRNEFIVKFRQFLVTALRQNETFGTDGLKALYADESREEVVDSLNSLIFEFNEAMKFPEELARFMNSETDGQDDSESESEDESKKKKKPPSTVIPVPAPLVPVPPKDGKPKSGETVVPSAA